MRTVKLALMLARGEYSAQSTTNQTTHRKVYRYSHLSELAQSIIKLKRQMLGNRFQDQSYKGMIDEFASFNYLTAFVCSNVYLGPVTRPKREHYIRMVEQDVATTLKVDLNRMYVLANQVFLSTKQRHTKPMDRLSNTAYWDVLDEFNAYLVDMQTADVDVKLAHLIESKAYEFLIADINYYVDRRKKDGKRYFDGDYVMLLKKYLILRSKQTTGLRRLANNRAQLPMIESEFAPGANMQSFYPRFQNRRVSFNQAATTTS